MVTRVKLEGLNIVKARGRFYVYLRESGEPLLKGFEGNRSDLLKRLAMPDMIALYNSKRKRDLRHAYPPGTLGALVEWFTHDCPRYAKLAQATKDDYDEAYLWLRPEFDAPLDTITQPALYEVRDRCAVQKWPRFADKMMAALSSMFTEAVKRGKMPMNPAKGLDKAHKADPNANREWLPDEVKAAFAKAPADILTPLMLARHAGFRGQTIAKLQWKNYQPDAHFGKCFRIVVRKNKEPVWIPAVPELQAYLDGLTRTSVNIATKGGKPWPSEKEMQTDVSHFLRDMERNEVIGAGTTLHGLRVTYAADLKRGGTDTDDIAAALGDRSAAMGKHYTRHVESEAKVIRAFEKKKR